MKKRMFEKSISFVLSVVMMIGICLPFSATAIADDSTKEIQIVSINDFHGSLAEEAGEKGKNLGMAKIVGQIKKYRSENPNTIVVSAGDNYQGSAMSNLTYGAPVSEMLKQMGVVASAVGNHEFDWGIERTQQWEKDGGFKFVAANIVDKKSGEPVTWAEPYVIEEIDGVKVAFIGITTPQTAFQTAVENVKDYEFKDVKQTAEKYVKEIRDGKLADVVIALTHIGSNQDRESKEVGGEILEYGLQNIDGLDAIISGHSHQTVAGEIEGMPIVQAYKYGRCIGRLNITLNEKNEVLKVVPTVDAVYNTKSEIIEDPTTKASFDKFSEELNPIMSEVVGKTDIELTHDRKNPDSYVSVLGYLISDIIRKDVDAQIGVVNSGGVRVNIPKGDITMGKMYEVLPFDNTIIKTTLTGEQLKRVLNNGIANESIGWVETAGVQVEIDLSKPFGDRINNIYLENGEKVEMDKEYTVATIDFIFDGGDKYDFSGAKDTVNTYVPMRDVVVDYLKSSGNINFEFKQPLVQGTITPVAKEEPKPEKKEEPKEEVKEEPKQEETKADTQAIENTTTQVEKSNTTMIIVIILIVLAIGVIVVLYLNKKKQNKNQ